MTLYRMVELKEGEPVQYIGTYVLQWGKPDAPLVGFVEVDDDEDEQD